MKSTPGLQYAFAVTLVTSCLSAAPIANMATPPAQIAVSPSKFEIAIGPQPTTESLTVMNLGTNPVTVQVRVESWDLDESNSVRLVEPTEQSLDQWMMINPLRFTIPSRKSQIVRFSVRPKVLPEPGEHRAMIYFDQVLVGEEHRNIRIKFSFGVAVYGLAEGVTRIGRLNVVKIEEGTPPRASFDISSEGSAHVRMKGQYAIYRAWEYPGVARTAAIEGLGQSGKPLPDEVVFAGHLPSRPVLPGTRRRLFFNLPTSLAPGRYVLDVNGTLTGKPIDSAITFTVPLPARPADGLDASKRDNSSPDAREALTASGHDGG